MGQMPESIQISLYVLLGGLLIIGSMCFLGSLPHFTSEPVQHHAQYQQITAPEQPQRAVQDVPAENFQYGQYQSHLAASSSHQSQAQYQAGYQTQSGEWGRVVDNRFGRPDGEENQLQSWLHHFSSGAAGAASH